MDFRLEDTAIKKTSGLPGVRFGSRMRPIHFSKLPFKNIGIKERGECMTSVALILPTLILTLVMLLEFFRLWLAHFTVQQLALESATFFAESGSQVYTGYPLTDLVNSGKEDTSIVTLAARQQFWIDFSQSVGNIPLQPSEMAAFNRAYGALSFYMQNVGFPIPPPSSGVPTSTLKGTNCSISYTIFGPTDTRMYRRVGVSCIFKGVLGKFLGLDSYTVTRYATVPAGNSFTVPT